MRRRELFKSGGTGLTLSKYSETVEPNASSITVTAYYNDAPITNGTSSMLSYDGTVVNNCSINSNGVITVSYRSNTDTTSSKAGYMQITYSGQTAQLVITQNADYVVNTRYETRERDRKYHMTSLGDVWELGNCGGEAVIGFNGNAYDTYTEITYRYTTYKSGNTTSTETSRISRTGPTKSRRLYAVKYDKFTIRTNGQSQSISNASVNSQSYAYGSTDEKVSATVTLTSDVTQEDAGSCLEGTANVTMTFNGSSYTTNNARIVIEDGTDCYGNLCWF